MKLSQTTSALLISIVLFFLLAVAFFIENVFISFPLVFLLSFMICFLNRNTIVYAGIFIITFLFDLSQVTTIGFTTLLLFLILFITTQENISVNVHDIRFLPIVLLGSSLMYSLIRGYSVNVFIYIIIGVAFEFITIVISKKSVQKSPLT